MLDAQPKEGTYTHPSPALKGLVLTTQTPNQWSLSLPPSLLSDGQNNDKDDSAISISASSSSTCGEGGGAKLEGEFAMGKEGLVVSVVEDGVGGVGEVEMAFEGDSSFVKVEGVVDTTLVFDSSIKDSPFGSGKVKGQGLLF